MKRRGQRTRPQALVELMVVVLLFGLLSAIVGLFGILQWQTLRTGRQAA